MSPGHQRVCWVVAAVGLIAGLLVLDTNRSGPLTAMERCNLALSTSSDPPADVLILGSSRIATAVDPDALEAMLAADAGVGTPTIERIALARNPHRVTGALLDNYLRQRGEPRVVVLEVGLPSDTSYRGGNRVEFDEWDVRRDAGLVRYVQLAPRSAHPAQLRQAAQGIVLRSGGLAHQFAHDPGADLSRAGCDTETWTREPSWPAGFAFAGGATPRGGDRDLGSAAERIPPLRAALGPSTAPHTVTRPVDLDHPDRADHLAVIDQASDLATGRGVPVVLVPLTDADRHLDPADAERLQARYHSPVEVLDLYGATGVDLSAHWYDERHLESGVAVALTTAVLADHLTDYLAEHGRTVADDGGSAR